MQFNNFVNNYIASFEILLHFTCLFSKRICRWVKVTETYVYNVFKCFIYMYFTFISKFNYKMCLIHQCNLTDFSEKVTCGRTVIQFIFRCVLQKLVLTPAVSLAWSWGPRHLCRAPVRPTRPTATPVPWAPSPGEGWPAGVETALGTLRSWRRNGESEGIILSIRWAGHMAD